MLTETKTAAKQMRPAAIKDLFFRALNILLVITFIGFAVAGQYISWRNQNGYQTPHYLEQKNGKATYLLDPNGKKINLYALEPNKLDFGYTEKNKLPTDDRIARDDTETRLPYLSMDKVDFQEVVGVGLQTVGAKGFGFDAFGNFYLFGVPWTTFLFGVMAYMFWQRRRMKWEFNTVRKTLVRGSEFGLQRLGWDLHGGPVAQLDGIIRKINSLQSPNSELLTVRTALEEETAKLREVCYNLRPPALDDFGLDTAISDYVDRVCQNNTEIRFTTHLDEEDRRLPEEVRTTFFRVMQDAVNNSVKHSRAKQVHVRFVLTNKFATLEVEDNGRGFVVPKDWTTLGQQNHFGLIAMQEQAALIDADLTIHSEIDRGTLIKLHYVISSAFPQNLLETLWMPKSKLGSGSL